MSACRRLVAFVAVAGLGGCAQQTPDDALGDVSSAIDDARSDLPPDASIPSKDVGPAVVDLPRTETMIVDAPAMRDATAIVDTPLVDVPIADAPAVDAGHPGGYTLVTSSTATWSDACAAAGHRSYLHGADDLWVETEHVGFAFAFWGTTFPATAPIAIDSNGWFAFGTYDPGGPDRSDGTIPSTVVPNGVVAAQWTDLQLFETTQTNQFVCVASAGAMPNRRYVIEWQNVSYFGGASGLTFEIVLTETTNTIDILYNRLDRAQIATVGLESPDGTRAVSPCASGTRCVLASGLGFRFVPGP